MLSLRLMNSPAAILLTSLVVLGISGGCAEYGGGAGVVPDVVVIPADLSSDAGSGGSGTAVENGTGGSGETVEPGGVGSFKGKVVLTGNLPSLPLPLIHGKGAPVKDAASCSKEDVPDESLVVSTDGSNGVANVFVYLARKPKGVSLPPVPDAEIVYDQISCKFVPHCVSVTTGQKISVVNADGVPHNAHSYPSKQTGINGVVNPNDRVGIELIYQRAETVPLKVACDFHTWMVGYHLPLDHPFHAVTDANGDFEIPGLPAGEYEFVVWHENVGYVHRKFPVTVKGGDPEIETVDFPADKLSLN